MAIIQEHFITADEKERSGYLKKKKKGTLKLTDYSTVILGLGRKRTLSFIRNLSGLIIKIFYSITGLTLACS